MLYNVYAIYDKTAEEFGPPVVAVNDGIAKRWYRNQGIPESIKDEYQLHMIGTYDSKTGDIIPEMRYTLNLEENNGKDI